MPRLFAFTAPLLLAACVSSVVPDDGAVEDATLADTALEEGGTSTPVDGSAPDDGDVSTPTDATTPLGCAASVSEASLCIGTASARAGERVAIPVYVVLPAGCPHTTQSAGTLVPSTSVGTFVVRQMRPPECASVTPMGDGAIFARLSESAASRCPIRFEHGAFMDVELDVASATAPGTYDLALTAASLGDNIATMTGGCRGKGRIAGQLIVLP